MAAASQVKENDGKDMYMGFQVEARSVSHTALKERTNWLENDSDGR
jgi:hypothetical protein